VRALADVADVDGAGFHGSDDGRAVGELDEVDLEAFLSEVALMDGGFDRPQAAVVGHVSDVEGLGRGDAAQAQQRERQDDGKKLLHGVFPPFLFSDGGAVGETGLGHAVAGTLRIKTRLNRRPLRGLL